MHQSESEWVFKGTQDKQWNVYNKLYQINNQAYVTLTVYGDVHALGGMTQW